MQLFSNDDGTWQIQDMGEIEFLMLSKLKEAVDPGDSQAAKDRLYPSPLGRPAMADEEDEMVDDWESLIHPDLESQFKKSVDVVLADLGRIEREGVDDIEYFLVVPKKHADDWVSTLNQARLVLHEKHNLPDEDDALAAIEGDTDERDNGIKPDQWLAMVQADIYAGIIQFLIQEVLWLK